MRQFFILIAALGFLSSCKKVDKNFATPVYEVTAEQMKDDLKAGRNIEFYEINLDLYSPLLPVDTNEARYNIRYFEGAVKRIFLVNLIPWDSNAAFSANSYIYLQQDLFGKDSISGVSNSQYYAENNTEGLTLLGKRTQAVTFSSNGVTITYPSQTVKNSQAIIKAQYPLTHRKSWAGSDIVQSYKFNVSAPSLGVPSATGEERRTIDYNHYVISSGLINFQGYDVSTPVLVVRETYNTKTDYYVNGALAPAPLLSLAGLTQGATTTSVSYSYYSPNIGYFGTIFMNSSNTRPESAFFKKLQ